MRNAVALERINMSKKMAVVQMSLKNAAAWEAKGESAWADSCISMAVMNLLSIAVEEHSTCANATGWLRNMELSSLLQRALTHQASILREVDAGKLPISTLGGNYAHLVYAHLSWALEDFQIGEFFVKIAERKDLTQISTPFWREYARAMGCLVRSESYEMRPIRLRGQEEYWAYYMRLIQAVCNGRDPNDALAEVSQAFVRRNADTRIKDDNYESEGSGIHPVKWDYRRDSLLAYIASKARQ
jgi:hypothetical protein